MQAVVMAGGSGTRLRPLTSNQPKPMVPIAGKPCIEHVFELLAHHGFEDVTVTLAYLPQTIRTYFGSGASLGLRLRYATEEVPLGTAGSVRRISELLEDTFLVVSGDALCDINLTRLVATHRRSRAAATLAVKQVPDPLEYGVVVADEDGRIERFLEKPQWGQVRSDLVNTGVYVVEPGALRRVPKNKPYDFARQLFPALLRAGAPLVAHRLSSKEYWRDIGTIEQYADANRDALDGRVRVVIPGLRLDGKVWLGHGATLADPRQVEGPAVIGANATIQPGARIGAFTILGANSVMREGAVVTRSVIDTGAYIGVGAEVQGAILGRGVDIGARAQVLDQAILGDECSIGQEAVLAPGVRVFPTKVVEPGARLDRSLVWESRALAERIDDDGMNGDVNVSVTAEAALRLAIAFGTEIGRGQRVGLAWGADPAEEMLARAVSAGLLATGLDVVEFRHRTSGLLRVAIRREGLAGGVDVREPDGTERIRLALIGPDGATIDEATRRAVEQTMSRRVGRRAPPGALGRPVELASAEASYAEALRGLARGDQIGLRIIFDYGNASIPIAADVLTRLGVDLIGIHAGWGTSPTAASLVRALSADMALIIDHPAERVDIVDDQGNHVSDGRFPLLMVEMLVRSGARGRVVMPVTASRHAEAVAAQGDISVERIALGGAMLARAARHGDALVALGNDGYVVLPSFTGGPDALATSVFLLDLVAVLGEPVSALVSSLPTTAIVTTTLPCPPGAKAVFMRRLVELGVGEEVDDIDGVTLQLPDGVLHVRPDASAPVVHVQVEAPGRAAADELLERQLALLGDLLADDAPSRTPGRARRGRGLAAPPPAGSQELRVDVADHAPDPLRSA